MFAGVPISMALCLSYILSYTFLGIPLYKNNRSILEIKELIDQFFEGYKPEQRKDTPCNPLGFLDKVINYTTMIFNYIYDNCINIGFLIVMGYIIIDSGINLKSNMLKLVTLCCASVPIIGFALYTVYEIIKSDNDEVSLNTVNQTEDKISEPIRQNPIYQEESPIIVENINNMEDVKNTVNNIANIFTGNQNEEVNKA